MSKIFKSRIVKIGEVGVDSGQLMICDPCYIESEFLTPNSKGKSDHAHQIYQHEDGTFWQFCYKAEPTYDYVNKFPGTYGTIIEKYQLSPNQLIEQGKFKKTDLDKTPHIPEGEFSYRGISKITNSENQGGQLKYKLGHVGAAVAFSSGFGDGTYEVYAEIVNTGSWGERVKKVYVELISDEELTDMQNDYLSERN